MARSLKFAYPGGKGNLSKTILSLMPSDGERFVDVFAGRGNVTWAVMSLLNYRRFWINALGTINFFKELRWLGPAPAAGPLTIRERTRKYYEGSKKESLQAYLATSIPEFESLGATRLVDMLKRGQKLASADEMGSPLSPVTEAYLSYNGGTYSSTGPMNDKGGGVSRKGMIAKMHQAGLMLEQNWKRIKLTALDYRKVIDQCTSRDMVYLDPPYKNADVKTYDTKTIDFPGLVNALLHANFRWVLSEYWDEVYRPLGEPYLRISVRKANHRGGVGELAEECLWTNFEPPCLTERKTMPKIDSGDLLAALQKERDDIDAAIRALTRTINKNFPPNAPDAQTPSTPKKKGKRKLSPQARKLLSEAAKKRWANRAKA